MAVVMATTCAVAKLTITKTTPSVTLIHTPPPTGILPTFYDGKTDKDKIKK